MSLSGQVIAERHLVAEVEHELVFLFTAQCVNVPARAMQEP